MCGCLLVRAGVSSLTHYLSSPLLLLPYHYLLSGQSSEVLRESVFSGLLRGSMFHVSRCHYRNKRDINKKVTKTDVKISTVDHVSKHSQEGNG